MVYGTIASVPTRRMTAPNTSENGKTTSLMDKARKAIQTGINTLANGRLGNITDKVSKPMPMVGLKKVNGKMCHIFSRTIVNLLDIEEIFNIIICNLVFYYKLNNYDVID